MTIPKAPAVDLRWAMFHGVSLGTIFAALMLRAMADRIWKK
jgi:hypothetical protein